MTRLIRLTVALLMIVASFVVIIVSLYSIVDRRATVKLSESFVLKTEFDSYPEGITELTLSLRNDGRYSIGGFNTFALDKRNGEQWENVAGLSGKPEPPDSVPLYFYFDLKPSEAVERTYVIYEADKWNSKYDFTAGEYRIRAVYEVYEVDTDEERLFLANFLAYAYFSVQ